MAASAGASTWTSAPRWMPGPEVEYAAFVKMNGVTTWDPFNNHFIKSSVNEQRPVRLLQSGVVYEKGAVVLSGVARVLNVSESRSG